MGEDIKIELWNPLTTELKNLLCSNGKVEELTGEEILNKYGDYLTNAQKSILKQYGTR